MPSSRRGAGSEGGDVFISGVFFTGPPSKVLEAWRDQRVTVVPLHFARELKGFEKIIEMSDMA